MWVKVDAALPVLNGATVHRGHEAAGGSRVF